MTDDFQNRIIRILVAESNKLIRLGLRSLIENQPSLTIVAESNCLDDVFSLAAIHKPNVILLDLLLNDGNCIEHIPQLLHICPQSRILAFSCNNEEQTQLDVLRFGAAGIIAKNQSTELLLKAIHTVNAGHFWFDRHLVNLLWQTQVNHHQVSPSINNDVAKIHLNCLTVRETSVACLSSQGQSAKKIGEQLFISEKTVRNLLTSIYDKLGVEGQIDLCMKATQFGFCDLLGRPCNRDKCPIKKDNIP
jgi:DNA-binding NarL/FixJ family response regulator